MIPLDADDVYALPVTPDRAAEVADRLALRERLAAALDPALIEAAVRVRDALVAKRYDATIGEMEKAQSVVVRHVKSDESARVDAITQKAAAPMWGDCRHMQSYITITIKVGRAEEMLSRWIARKGDGGIVFAPGQDGPMTRYGTRDHGPVHVGGYDE